MADKSNAKAEPGQDGATPHGQNCKARREDRPQNEQILYVKGE